MRTVILLALTGVFGGVSRWAEQHGHNWLSSITSNLSAGFLTAFLIVTLVDSALERERKRQIDRFRVVALASMRPILLNHLSLLCRWHKAAAANPPPRSATTFEELFDDAFYTAMLRFDLSRPAATAPATDWFAYSAKCFEELTGGVNEAIDKYAVFMSSDMLVTLEGIVRSPLVGIIAGAKNLVGVSGHFDVQRTFNLFAGDGAIRAVHTHIDAVCALVRLFNDHAERRIRPEELHIFWESHMAPQLGSARMTNDEFASSNPMFFVRSGPPQA